MPSVRFLVVIIIFIFLFPCCSNDKEISKAPITGPAKWKENHVLLITIDTLRLDRVGVYSSQFVKTPHMDNLASKSFLFFRAFAHNPVTLPSHVNILTGTTPPYHGISDNSGFRLEKRFLTLAEHLKANGYETGAFIGAFPLDSRFGLNQGFDIYDDNYGTHNRLDFFFVERKADKVIEPAKQWMKKRTKKWFAWIHLFDPHQPYQPSPPYDEEYADDAYSGEVAFVDTQLGKLFDFLQEEGLFERTIIVLTSDHGEALGEKGERTHSYFAYNNTIHIPLMIYVPASGSKKVEENVCHADIFPTLCDLLKLDIPSHLQGESLLPIIKGEARKSSEIYFESLTPYLNRGWSPLKGFVKGSDKFINLPIKELYDLDQDIKENKNLAKEGNVGKFQIELNQLIKNLTGKEKTQRSSRIDPDSLKKLKTLGYVSGVVKNKKQRFTKKDDLKILLPIQNEMLSAMGEYHKGNVEDAVQRLKRITEESPQFLLVYHHLAKIYKDTGRIESALKVLREGLKSNPGNPAILSKLGIFLTEINQIDEAIKILTQCVRENHTDPENFNYLGVAHYRKGNFQLALGNYQKALEIDSNYASIYNNLGSLYLSVFVKEKDEKAYNLAFENFCKAIDFDPNLASAHNGRGAAYYFKGKTREAISDWKQAISIKPDFIDPYFSIGIAYLKLKDKASALTYFTLCKERCYSKMPPPGQQRLDRLINQARN